MDRRRRPGRAEAEDLKALKDVIKTANDPPATLTQLQENALKPSEPGYQNHHIDEQALLRSLGYSQSEIDRPDNIVRTPTLKHYQITGWYAERNSEYGGLSPREYLRSQPESVRRRVAAVAPPEARRKLEAIADSQWFPQAGDAGMSLLNLDRGIFKPTRCAMHSRFRLA